MTLSIVAWDENTRAVGVAVATHFMAVGSLCPLARPGVGALAAQAFIHPAYGPRALELLALDVPPDTALQILLQDDEAVAHRQLHLVDAQGNTAAYTGEDAAEWAGHRTFSGFSLAGNMLASGSVLDAMATAYQQQSIAGQDLTTRLVQALLAGQEAGGDLRGVRSAALYIAPLSGLPIDLRVDEHGEPVNELHRLHTKALTEYHPLRYYLDTTARAVPPPANPPTTTSSGGNP